MDVGVLKGKVLRKRMEEVGREKGLRGSEVDRIGGKVGVH